MNKATRDQLVGKLIVLQKFIDSVSSCLSSTDIRYRKLIMGMKINQSENSVILMSFFVVNEGFRVGSPRRQGHSENLPKSDGLHHAQ